MGAWGYGLFESDHDLDIVGDLNVEAGLEELEKASKLKRSQGTPAAKTGGDEEEGEEDEPYYTIHGGGDAPEEIRKHLDSGILEKLFAKKEQEMLNPSKHAWVPDYVFCLLGACAMTLGCRIPQHYKLQMQKHFLNTGMMEAAERQMFKALNGPNGYQEGVPYHFDLPEDVVAAQEAEMESRMAKGGIVGLNVAAPHGLFAGPPKDKVLRTTMNEGKFGNAGCGGCGVGGKRDGGDLLRCAKCKKRGYCSTDCQKEHWKLHKKVCVAVTAEAGKEDAAAQKMYAAGRGA